MLALLAALCLLAYQVAPTPIWPLALLVYLVVAYRSPTAGLFAVILALPYYFEPRMVYRESAFSTAEVGAVLTTLAAVPGLLGRAWRELPSVRASGVGAWLRKAWSGWGWVALGGVALVLLGFLSLAASVRLAESLRSLRTIILEPVALLFVALYAPDQGSTRVGRERAAWLTGAVVLSATLTSLYGLSQLFTGVNLVVAEDGIIRIRGLYGSPNNLALFVGRALPLAACIFAFGRGVWRWAAGVALLLMTAAVLFTYSIGAWAALPVALLVVAAIRGRRVLLTLVGAGLALAVVSLPFLLRTERFSSHLGLTSGTNIFRVAVWSAALAMIRDHPILGIGLDNFLYYYRDLHYMPAYGEGDPNLSHPHNILFDFWLSLGFLGLVLAVVLLWRFGSRALRLYRETAGESGWTPLIVLGLIGGMADAVLHGMIDNSYFLPDLAVLFWIFFAVLSLVESGRDASPARSLETRATRPRVEEATS